MGSEFSTLKARLAGCRYLLVVLPPYYRDEAGQVWLDRLWHRDLVAHLHYLSDLTVLAPCEPVPDRPDHDLVRIDPATAPGLRFLEMSWPGSTSAAIRSLPRMARLAFRAVRDADLVHSGVAGWPIPPGVLVNPLAVLMRRPLVIVVESAPWRLTGAGPHSRGARLRAGLNEVFARWSVRRGRLNVFTQPDYQRQLAKDARGECVLAPATWVDADDILSEPEAASDWQRKPETPRFVMAARLTEAKGVGVLLAALRLAEARGLPLDVTLIGSGELEGAARALAAEVRTVRFRVADPISYGAPFLRFLRGFHAALVPTLSDEQPRILFDAFSQALPVLATDVAGNQGLVVDGETGRLVPPGDVEALLAVMIEAARDRGSLEAMGLRAREVARSRTHRAMHLDRARRLAEIVGRPGTGSAPGGRRRFPQGVAAP